MDSIGAVKRFAVIAITDILDWIASLSKHANDARCFKACDCLQGMDLLEVQRIRYTLAYGIAMSFYALHYKTLHATTDNFSVENCA